MLQIASFKLPEQQKEANEFLATHKPANQGVNLTQDIVVIFYEDYSNPVAYQIDEYSDFLQSVRAARFQQEVALFTMQNERDTLNPTHNKVKYEDLSAKIMEVNQSMKLQDHKIAFLEGKIADLKAQL